jgi:hypothetical protein
MTVCPSDIGRELGKRVSGIEERGKVTQTCWSVIIVCGFVVIELTKGSDSGDYICHFGAGIGEYLLRAVW